jgi:putative glutamine amidotransferase
MKFFPFLLFLFGTHLSQSQQIRIATIRDNSNVKSYVQSIDSTVVLINFAKLEKRKWKQELKKCQGIILSGGADIHPKRYGKNEYTHLCELEEKRDELEWRLLTLAAQDSLPIFGICRGMQFINVFYGGTLCPDFQEVCSRSPESAQIHRDKNLNVDVLHPIYLNTESVLFPLFQSERVIVNSWHHQSVDQLANGFLVGAVADDGTIESIEQIKDKCVIIGVQWHPERMKKSDQTSTVLMSYFLSQCRRKGLIEMKQ